MHKRARIVIPILLVVIIVIVWVVFFRYPPDDGTLIISGNIEVTDAQLSFQIPGRVSERLVTEGDSVSAGQLIARLDGADQVLAVAQAEGSVALATAVLAELQAGSRPEAVSQSRAQVAQAQAQLAQLETGSRAQEIADAEAAVDRAQAAAESARAQLELAEADYARSAELLAAGVIPQQKHDAARTAREAARRNLEQAAAGVDSARQRLSLVREGPRSEQVDAARAALRQAEAGSALVVAGPRAETIDQASAQLEIARETLNLARQHLAYTELTAPFTGVVLSKSAEAGEYINPGSPIVALSDLDHVWLRGYVNETNLSQVRLGQAVTVTTDTYPDKTYEGRISFISDQAEFTPKAVQTSQERVKLMYLVKVELANPNHELKPGMPADAVIQLAE